MAYIRFLGGTDQVPVSESVGVHRVVLAVTDEFGRFTCSCDFEFRVNVATESGTASKEVAGFINPRRACAARVTVVGSVCVCAWCVCLKSHLTSRMSNRAIKEHAYLVAYIAFST